MNIEQIYIDGFRSIKELTMKVNGNLQIIIGKNDTGKSNILRSLDLFFNNSIDKEQLIWERDFNTTYLRAKGKNAPNCITLHLKYKLPKAYSESKLYRALIDSLGDSFYIGKRIYQNRSEIYYSKNEVEIFNSALMENSDIYQNVVRFMGYIHYFYVPINKDESWLKESYIFEDIKNRFMDAWGKGGTSRKKISELRNQIEKLLKGIQDAVDDGMNEVTKGFVELFPDYKKVTFKTPKSANDLFRLLEIEVLSEGNISTTLGARGSGVQSASIPLLLIT